VQAVAEVHETPFRRLALRPRGFGVRWIDQRLPFQRSTNPIRVGLPPGVVDTPTAMQNLPDVHDTPLSVASSAPTGLVVRWIDQRLPFQCSASGASRPRANFAPTALQAVADVHDTALSAPTPGERTTAQVAVVARAASGSNSAHATQINRPTAIAPKDAIHPASPRPFAQEATDSKPAGKTPRRGTRRETVCKSSAVPCAGGLLTLAGARWPWGSILVGRGAQRIAMGTIVRISVRARRRRRRNARGCSRIVSVYLPIFRGRRRVSRIRPRVSVPAA
jgi:hypothetical protein